MRHFDPRLAAPHEGVVVDTNDPQQMNRMKVWVPAVDGDLYNVADLPWVTYVSPLAGQTRNYPAGPGADEGKGLVSYGMVMTPKIGAQVIVSFVYGDPNKRIYVGSFFRDHGNRSLPAGRNSELGAAPLTDTLDPLEPQASNLAAQFGGDLSASEAQTRGVFERQVAQAKTAKDGAEGYQQNVVTPTEATATGDKKRPVYDPQTYALTTPGRHSIIMQDHPTTGRVRIKTAAGHQVILDDANERVYISTARGAVWIELDQDGRLHARADAGVHLSTGGDFEVAAAGAIRLAAGKGVHVQAGAEMSLAACAGLSLSGKGVNLESTAAFNVLAAGSLVQTGSQIHLNGPKAAGATCPTPPAVVPAHEPWKRPASKGARNKNWKP
jgi:hypothetical protein